jgi:MtrB/PioB family decaheme-associated outer membrane protein
MTLRRSGWLLFAAVFAVLAVAPPAAAQLQLGGFNIEGVVEPGVRFFVDEPSQRRKGKLEEYRDIPEGLFLNELRLRFFRPDSPYSSEIAGSKWGQEDQEFALSTGRLGLWQFDFQWDQTPHIFTTTARLLATRPRPNVFELPTALQNTASLPLHNAAPFLDEVSVRWDTARMRLNLTPTPDLDITTQYTRIHKHGDRPFGMSFGSPGGNFYEILEPLDHIINDFQLRATLARERWQLQLVYNLSHFDNAFRSVVADNPSFATFTTANARTGAVSLAPDNMAHTVNIAGGVTLPLRTRLTANVGYSLRLQDDSFVGHTVNPVILAANAAALTLPQRDLDGRVGVFNVNVNAVTRPFQPLTLTARYRLFDYNDMTDALVFPARVRNDTAFQAGPFKSERFSFTRHNADVDTRWRLAHPVALTVGAGWERWDRGSHREVRESNEYIGKLALDVTPTDWLVARLAYRPSFRETEGYRQVAAPQIPTLRKFDMAERRRHRIEAIVNLIPAETLTVSPTFSYFTDDYPRTTHGVRDNTGWSAGFDFSWSPIAYAALSGGYLHERGEQTMRGRNRNTGQDFPQWDWLSEIADRSDTVYLDLTVSLLPNVLEWRIGANYQTATTGLDTANLGLFTAVPATAAQIEAARAKPAPAMSEQLWRLETALRYRFARAWTATVGYAFESFERSDWHTNQLIPWVPQTGQTAGTPTYLGAKYDNYAAHLVGLTLGYRF